MINGPLVRTRRHQKKYLDYKKTHLDDKACDFCNFTYYPEQVIQEYRLFWVVTNLFKYDFWDSTGVEDQLMAVPKRHIVGLGEFTTEERGEYFSIVTTYENQGYSIYARAPSDPTKSVLHQHTHFIKLDGKPKKAVLYLSKPHIALYK